MLPLLLTKRIYRKTMKNDKMNAKTAKQIYNRIKDNIHTVIIGQDDVVENAIITIMCNAHSIITGVPGLAKTLIVKLMAITTDMAFNRIQFTPDLMPSDITGTVLIKKSPSGDIDYGFVRGPVFCNILLADEINRTPPKTQSALLQAMEERFVSIEGEHYSIDKPFHVFATQNPIEQEGTYPLPEAQLDRFMFDINIHYPKGDEELGIISTRGIDEEYSIKKNIVSKEEILAIQAYIREMPAASNMERLVLKIIRNTRPEQTGIEHVKQYIKWGASPRAGMYIIAAAKAKALIDGRLTPDKEDIINSAPLVLGHRLILSFKGEMENISKGEIIDEIIKNSL